MNNRWLAMVWMTSLLDTYREYRFLHFSWLQVSSPHPPIFLFSYCISNRHLVRCPRDFKQSVMLLTPPKEKYQSQSRQRCSDYSPVQILTLPKCMSQSKGWSKLCWLRPVCNPHYLWHSDNPLNSSVKNPVPRWSHAPGWKGQRKFLFLCFVFWDRVSQ